MGVNRVTAFSESRATRDTAGIYRTNESSIEGDHWKPGAVATDLALRASDSSESGGMPIVGTIHPLSDYRGLLGVLRSFRLLRRSIELAVRESDVICIKQPGVIGILAARAAERMGIPVVCEVVGDAQDVLQAGVVGPIGRWMAPWVGRMTRRTVRQATLVRYVTRYTLQARYPPAIGSVAVALSDVVPFIAAGEPRAVIKGRVVAAGSQEQHYKGHDLLLRSVAALASELPQISLALLGDGRRQAELRALASELGIGDRVIFAGQVTNRDMVRKWFETAQVFAMPSRTEGMPRAMIEAMSLGVPAVGTRAGGIIELVAEDALVDVGDVHGLTAVLRRVLTDSAFAAELAKHSEVTAEFYAERRSADALAQWNRALTTVADRSKGNR